jgi:exopolysaccharide biosynthesis polyprenyl glycosylphosphotransferase
MIRRHAAVFRLTLAVADSILAILVVSVAVFARFGELTGWPAEGANAGTDPRVAVATFVAIWIAVLWLHGLYRSRARLTTRAEMLVVLRATTVMVAITLSLLFFFKLPDVSRLLLLIIFPAIAAAAIGIRIVMRRVLVLAREHGRNSRYMLVVGANAAADAFADLVDSHPELGLVVIGHLKGPHDREGSAIRPLLGKVKDLETVLHSRIVDEVAICLPYSDARLIEQVTLLCEEEGRMVRIPIAPVERVLRAGRVETVDGVGIYSIANGPDRAVALLIKRSIDLIGAAGLLVVLAPVAAMIGLAIKLGSQGPILFRQERVGLHGRTFEVFKFRSMVTDAEEHLDGLLAHNQITGHAFKMDRDPRVTRVGRVLRRTSLDELPQLWNVLAGQMSLVGPRPPLPSEVAQYDVWHRRRLSMTPGMTGLWQVGARRSPDFDDWVEQDLRYIDSWSLWLDLKIIARTVPAVLAGTGR